MSGQGYIYIPNWDGSKGFQHYGNRRPTWIKNYLDLLDNDAYLDLSLADRGVLHAIWMLVARVGQGRCIYSASYLQKQCNAPAGHMRRSLERLNQAGFIEVRASRALAPVYQPATPEGEGSSKEEPKKKVESARENGAAVNGADRALEEHHRQTRVRTHYNGFLLENGEADALEWLAENHPDLVGVIAGTKPATKETA